jgi:fumarate hydratase subunit beta
MAIHHLKLPLSHETARALAVEDVVYLTGEITATGGLPGHKRIAECLSSGTSLPVRQTGTFFHLPTMMKETGAGYRVEYVNPTTSMRFASFAPDFIRGLDLSIVAGKGGLDAAALEAMREVGCIYLSMLGGGSPMLTEAIRDVLEVEWLDLPSHFRLITLRVENLGPFTVGMDADGGSIYERLASGAQSKLPHILSRLAAARDAYEAEKQSE